MGDDKAYALAAQLAELLGTKRMMEPQLASAYSIKHGKSVVKVLSELGSQSLLEFVKGQPCFQVTGNVIQAIAQPVAPQTEQMKYADVSRGIQTIFKERKEPMPCKELEQVFESKFGTDIPSVVGMSTLEYLERKENIFLVDTDAGTVYLQPALLAGPPIADPSVPKDERFVVDEFEKLVEDAGPVAYISTLCGKFIQRNGIAVTSIIGSRPLDLFKRHPDRFLLLGGGNVTLRKFNDHPEVQKLQVAAGASKASRINKTAEERTTLPLPDEITEQHVVDEFVRLIKQDEAQTVYISSLCGRFLQRFKKPVTAILDERPADFLRKYDDIFVMTGGGHVGLREVLGTEVQSVPAAPRDPKKLERPAGPGIVDSPARAELVSQIVLTDHLLTEVHARLVPGDLHAQSVKEVRKLCEVLEAHSFLAVKEVTVGGSVGKGLVTRDTRDATVVLFVKQLPFVDHAKWLPHILETLQAVLEINMKQQNARFKADTQKGALTISLDRGLTVTVALSSVYKSHAHLLECISSTPPAHRASFQPCFVKQHVDFVANHKQGIEVVLRLVSWWVGKQTWTSAFTRPDPYLIELVVIHAALQLKAQKPQVADLIQHIFEIFANLDTIKVLWADTGAASYGLQDIWKPLLSHEPLFMDPCNPYVNLLDANAFDPRELIAAASKEGRMEAFQKEASFLPFVAASIEAARAEKEGS